MNKKKWTSLFLAFVMVLGILPFNVFATGYGDGNGELSESDINLKDDISKAKNYINSKDKLINK